MLPLVERRASLASALHDSGILMSDFLPGTAQQVAEAVRSLGLEGITQSTGIHPMQLHARASNLGPIDELGLTGISLDELVSGPDIAAMEVYDQPFEAPPEFMPSGSGFACGVIVVWTKRATDNG